MPFSLRDLALGSPPPNGAGGLGPLLRSVLTVIVFVVAATAIADVLDRYFGLTRLSPVFLAPVLLTGAWLGARPAIFAALLSFLAFNFYLVEPRFQLRVAAAEDWMNLVVFLIVALLTGTMSGRLRDQSSRIMRQAQALGSLLERSRALSIATDEGRILAETQAGIAQIGAAAAAVWRADEFRLVDLGPLDDRTASHVRELVSAALSSRNVETMAWANWKSRLMQIEGKPYAVAVWQTPKSGAPADTQQLIEVLIDLGAATVARATLSAAKNGALRSGTATAGSRPDR